MFLSGLFPIRIKMSIDGTMMLLFALMIDLISILLACVLLDDFWILDTAAAVIIGAWVFFKSGSMPSRKGNNQGEKLVKRFLGTMFAEIIPYLGALPFYSYTVYITLKEELEEEEAIRREEELAEYMEEEEEYEEEDEEEEEYEEEDEEN
jgi:hypothetical protein